MLSNDFFTEAAISCWVSLSLEEISSEYGRL
jgi:hypothetical protein